MKIIELAARSVLLIALSAGVAQSATLRNADEPAEFPPASFKGSQYVDSRGCVYIRSGVDGNVVWVPRVTRGRQHICGAQPTFAEQKAPDLPVIADSAPAAAPVPTPAPAVVPKPKPVAVAQRPVVVPAVTAPAATVRTTRQPMQTIASVTTPPQLVKPVAPAPIPRSYRPAAATGGTACSGLSPVAQRYMRSNMPVRCGPQDTDYASRRRGILAGRAPSETYHANPVVGQVVRQGQVPATTRVVPRHVYENQMKAKLKGGMPEGYRQVWEDDRLNPYRAHQTFAGKADMDLVWTRTVPRRLINRKTGLDVTNLFPNLRPPNTTTTRTSGQAVISSKSAAPKLKAPVQPKATDRTYVQVASYATPSKAQQAAQGLKRSGLPVRIWAAKRGGRDVQIVVLGPYGGQSQAKQALSVVKGIGYGKAFLRR